MRSFTLASLFIFFAFIFVLPSYASGQDTAGGMGFGISPVPVADPAVTANGYFIYKVHLSTTMSGSVLLKNPGSKPITVQLAAVDALTAQGGGSAFATSDVTPSGVATWLRFAESSITLPAGRQKSVDFTVTVPQNLRPGQYLSGISAYIPGDSSAAGANQGGSAIGASVTVQTRYVIAVQVDIEGVGTSSLKVESVALVQQPSGPFIGIHMKNDGSVFLKPSGTIVMTDAAGKRVLEKPIQMGTFIPGTNVVYPVRWSGELASGTYNVQVSLGYGENGKEEYEGQLEVGSTNAVQGMQKNNAEAQLPGTIGSSKVVAASPQAPATAQIQEGADIWPWILIGSGILLLAVGVLLSLNIVKMPRLQVRRKEL